MIRANNLYLLFMLMLAGTCHASNTTHSWSGLGANNKWSTVANWVGNSPPAVGESTATNSVTIVFAANATSTMDITGLVVDEIHFTGSGNHIGGSQTLTIDGSKITINIQDDAGGNSIDSTCPLAVTGASCEVAVATGTSTIAAGISGTVGFIVNGAGTLSMTPPAGNTYTGTTTVLKGVMLIATPLNQVIPGTLIIGNGVDPAGSAIVRENNQSNDIFSAAAVTINASGVLDMNNQIDVIGALSGTGSIMMGSTGALTVNNNSTTSQFDGTITGTGGFFAKAGAGSLTLTGNNTFAGTIAVNAGNLLLNSASGKPVQGSLVVGTGLGAANSVVCQLLMPNQIANTASVTVKSDGKFDLNNNAEATGDLTVTGGNVTITSVVLSAKSLTMTGGAVTATTGSLSLGGNITATSNAGGSATVTSAVALNATRTVTVNSGPIQPELLISGTISDGAASAGIFKSGTGTLNLLSASGNTYTGLTTVDKGVLQMNATLNFIISGNVVVGNTTDPANSAILRELQSSDIGHMSSMMINQSGVLDLNGHSDSIGSLSGTGPVLLGAGSFVIGGDNLSQSYAGLISGTGTLLKNGTGTQTISGNNTYTGNTFVIGGTLLVNGSQPSSAVTVSGGATLGGTGKVGNTTVTGSKLSPGINGPATLSTGNLSLDSASTVILNLVSGAAGGFGSVNVNGTVTLGNSTLTLNIDPNFIGQAVPISLIHNLGASAVSGKFNNFTEGQMVPLANLSSAFSYIGGASGKDVTLTPLNVPPVFTSGTMASPNPAGAGQTITFTAPASDANGDPLTYAWDFGDGSTSAVASPTHSYPTAGTYTVSVSVSDGFGGQVSGSVMVTVNPPLVGTGPDSDGDGFSDSFEAAVGTDPNNPNDSPTSGPATAGSIQPLTLTKASIKLNFAKANSDSIGFSGTFAVPSGFTVLGAKVSFDISSVPKTFTLDAKGSAKSGGASFKLGVKSKKGSVAAQTSKFAVSMKGSFASTLAAAGLVGTADVKSKPVSVVFTAIFNETLLQKTQQMTYTAKKGKSGAAK